MEGRGEEGELSRAMEASNEAISASREVHSVGESVRVAARDEMGSRWEEEEEGRCCCNVVDRMRGGLKREWTTVGWRG